MTYQFAGQLFNSMNTMCNNIAHEWLSAGGLNNEATQQEFLARTSDDALAIEAINDWELSGEWADDCQFEKCDLVRAFARLRAKAE